METKTTKYFDDLIELAQSVFDEVEYEIDSTPERAILRMQAKYGQYRVFVTELFSYLSRQYRYYLLRGNWIEAGFDNSSDPRAIRLKYGKIGKEHAGEYIPHLHLEDKTRLELTDEMTFFSFVTWMEENIS